jgi:hypothetical protein
MRNPLMLSSLVDEDIFKIILNCKYVKKEMFFINDIHGHNVVIYALNNNLNIVKLIIESPFWCQDLMYYKDIDDDFLMLYPYDKPDIVEYLLNSQKCDYIMISLNNKMNMNCSHYYAKYNSISLGICFEGNFMSETVTEEQRNSFGELVKYIRAKYGVIPIYGHKELYSTSCPGDNFPLQEFKNINVNEIYKIGWDEDCIGWFYRYNNRGMYYKDSWQLINSKWYSFDSEGYARIAEWIQDDGYWYYLKEDCSMAASEWIKYKDKNYYLNEHGEMLVNTTTPDGHKVDGTGACID